MLRVHHVRHVHRKPGTPGNTGMEEGVVKSLRKSAVFVAILVTIVGITGAFSEGGSVARAQTAGASATLYAANGTPVGSVSVVSTGAAGTQLAVTLQGPANATYAVCASSP